MILRAGPAAFLGMAERIEILTKKADKANLLEIQSSINCPNPVH